MEEHIPQKRQRGRPRKRKAEGDAIDAKSNIKAKRQMVEMRSMPQLVEMQCLPLVGRYVLKEFHGSGTYLGKVTHYDTGLYRVEYEDGDSEELESGELRTIILTDNDFHSDLSARKEKLDDLVVKNCVKMKNVLVTEAVESKEDVNRLGESVLSDGYGSLFENGEQIEGDTDSSAGSPVKGSSFETQVLLIPPPVLPPSSGTIQVQEEYVSHFLSVYGLLRSFSIFLFLSPFGLDEFAWAINCRVQNTLLDAIHLALMRALRRHLEILSSDGSKCAEKCLRCADWSLLDSYTWPVYLVQYLTMMGYTKGPEWKGFHNRALRKEYYSLEVDRKLVILLTLCDDILESAELRADIDVREETEVGIDPDKVVTKCTESGPRRIHPRYAKTLAYIEREAIGFIGGSQTKNMLKTNSEADVVVADDSADQNSDECLLCGMDGTLLCCDGCPSSYHSRCISVVKSSIPDGPWLCPECKINGTGPSITPGTSLRGAESFGIDVYEQVFFGTCDHLLIIRASVNTKPFLRYYNRTDIPVVLQALISSAQHATYYSGICKSILLYWAIPEKIVPQLKAVETSTVLKVEDERNCPSFSLPHIENPGTSDKSDEHILSSLGVAVDIVTRTELGGSIHDGEAMRSQDFLQNIKVPHEIKMESAMSTLTHTSQLSSYSRSVKCMDLPVKVSSYKEGNSVGVGNHDLSSADGRLCQLQLAKAHSYLNHYMQGYFAASAAANLADISSEEGTLTREASKLANARKIASANISLQVKAFSSAASRFFWPTSDRKLMEIPRERCGWCYACKTASSSKRGCLLNSAASAATKGAMKFLNGPVPMKLRDGSLASIATYVLYMEESLRGLIVGPFLNTCYRKQWRRRVEEASSCSALKIPLVELEENIRLIAFSGDWVKHMDDFLLESSMEQSTSCAVGTMQKRGLNGKRCRKQSSISEAMGDDSGDKIYIWWAGGQLWKSLFQRAILPLSIVSKAARQGGLRKIHGIHYADGSIIPKRSRRFIWRAAVEKAKTASQLSFQVRCLDLHVRWSDLVRSEQSTQDGKGPETEATAFRNATVLDKQIVKEKIAYGVCFGNQKHLPSRVMKNIIEIEQREDGNNKYWLPEIFVPLYLIKEYEFSVEKEILQVAKNPASGLSEVQRKQLKAARSDIFIYLALKRDKMDKCSCTSCQHHVLLRDAVKCSVCQGYCHAQCTQRSLVHTSDEAKVLNTCNYCYHPNLKESSSGSPTSPLCLQRQDHNVGSVTKSAKHKDYNQTPQYIRTQERAPEIKQATSISSSSARGRHKLCSWGVMWKKKKEDTGIEFRRKNVLRKGSPDLYGWRPTCILCKKSYNHQATYIHCETCINWYHAEAVELEDSKLGNVVGFKCLKCRKMKSPICPYDDSLDVHKAEGSKSQCKVLKEENIAWNSSTGISSAFKGGGKLTKTFPLAEPSMKENDPLVSGLNFEWNAASGMGPQKLPVRRHVKHEEEIEECNSNYSEAFRIPEINQLIDSNDELLCAQWDVSTNNFENAVYDDNDEVNYTDMEFEPQTYFTLEELLAPIDAVNLDEYDASGSFFEDEGNQSWVIPMDGVSDQCDIETLHRCPEPSSTITMPCHMCSHSEPLPDLSCEICNLAMHSYCNPWAELLPLEGIWRCANCQDWT